MKKMARFIIEQGSSELTSHAGLVLIGAALDRYTNLNSIDKRLSLHHGIAHSTILKTYVGFLCLGRSAFEAASEAREDNFFQQALGISNAPSCERLRQRLDEHAGVYDVTIQEASQSFLKNSGAVITPLAIGHVAVDVDVFTLDNSNSKKEGVSQTYKGFKGYAPIAGYIGQEGYCLALQLREGKQHCQNGTPFILKRLATLASELTTQPLLFRLDSGNDDTSNFLEFAQSQSRLNHRIDFIIKWNPRTKLKSEHKEKWLRCARRRGWQEIYPGVRECVFALQVKRLHKKTKEGGIYRRIMRITERTIDENGQRLLLPEVEIEGWWTSLKYSCEKVIALYDDRGTSEQFHSEFKTDLDIERLPSGKFNTNALVLSCAMLAYNLLRYMGQRGLSGEQPLLKKPAQRRRIKTVLQKLMYLAAKVVRTGRQLKLCFSRYCPQFNIFEKLYHQLVYG
jgi:hypothetical protein